MELLGGDQVMKRIRAFLMGLDELQLEQGVTKQIQIPLACVFHSHLSISLHIRTEHEAVSHVTAQS